MEDRTISPAIARELAHDICGARYAEPPDGGHCQHIQNLHEPVAPITGVFA